MQFLLLVMTGCTPGEAAQTPDAASCFRYVATTLSADDMDGRGIGTPGLARAADYLAETMKSFGFQAPVKDYRQPFSATTGVSLGAGNSLSDGSALTLGSDWTPAGFARSGTVDADLVFAGFGITAPDLGYDDYAGLDVKGKVVLAMRFEPGESDEKSVFDGKRASRFSDLRTKAIRAREAGAAALVLVSPPQSPDEPDKLPPLKTLGPQSDAGIPVIFVTRATADRWLASTGKTVTQHRDAIDATVKPVSTPLSVHLSATVSVVPTTTTSWNVVGVIPGKGKLKQEVVVLGAHYDHLGHGGAHSMRPDVDAIHNGADDNASGVAGALCSALALEQSKTKGDRRTIAVINFSAEEIGLGGSAAYVKAPVVNGETVAMVNLDMVGRVREGNLNVLGADSSPAWKGLVEEAAKATPELKIKAGGDGYGPSDQTSFYAEGVPVVHLFSGAHDQYHTPDDDASTLNFEGGTSVVRFTTTLVDALAHGERPSYARSVAGAPGGDSRGYGAYFGSVPDYSAMEAATGGVKLSDVRPGSPAEKGGIRKGDVIVAMAGTTVNNLYDMTYVLREHKPGDTIDVVVLRGAEKVTLRATLTQRGADAPKPAAPAAQPPPVDASGLIRPEETHFASLQRLTFGGDNAEAYWGPDGRRLILQITPKDGGCDQEYVYDLGNNSLSRVSSGKGRTTCGYFDYPHGKSLIYATTEGASAECPAKPDYSQGYVWPIYDSFEIVRDDGNGKRTTWNASPGYDAEATECMLDGRVVFTSTRNGDLDLYVANNDGSGLQQLTNTPGYDGGAFFTQDCKRIVFRASRPQGQELADYQRLLQQGLVRPTTLDLFVMDADGKNIRQLTHDNKASFAPYPTPDGKGVIYSSNRGGDVREFDLWYLDWAGGEPVRITTAPGFDGFPMFSPDGQWLAFSSNRANAPGARDTDLYLAKWK